MLSFQSRHAAAADGGLFDDHEPISITDSFKDSAVFHLDLTGRVINWSRGAERVFGFTGAGLRAREYPILLPDAANLSKSGLPLRTALAKGHYRITGWAKRSDGVRFWTETRIAPLMDQGQRATGFLAVVKDMTDHKRRIDHLRAALDMSRAVISDRPVEQALQLVARHARSLLHADGAHVTVPAAGSDRLVISVAEGWNAALLRGTNWPARGSMIARVMESGRPSIVDDASRALARPEPLARAARVGPILAVPLARRRRKIGTLVVYNRVGGPAFRPRDLEVLRRFASLTTLAVHHAKTQRSRHRTIGEERKRIARLLQGIAGQSLAPIRRRLHDAIACCQDPALRERLALCIDTIDGAVKDLRNCALGRRPRILSDHRLDEALLMLARDLELRAGLPTTVEMQVEAAERLTDNAGEVIQIVREALSNVARHAQAQHCRLRLKVDHGKTRLEIEDDGIGFDPRRVRGRREGLQNLRVRVARLGGRLRIETAPGAGTALRVAIPL